MRKKGLIAMSLFDVVSWILFALAIIIFYFLFKFNANETRLTIEASTTIDTIYPYLHLVHSPFSSELDTADALLNYRNQGRKQDIRALLDSRYSSLQETEEPSFFWEISLCDEKPLIDKPVFSRYNDCIDLESMGRRGTPKLETPVKIQIPNAKKDLFAYFLYSPVTYSDIRVDIKK